MRLFVNYSIAKGTTYRTKFPSYILGDHMLRVLSNLLLEPLFKALLVKQMSTWGLNDTVWLLIYIFTTFWKENTLFLFIIFSSTFKGVSANTALGLVLKLNFVCRELERSQNLLQFFFFFTAIAQAIKICCVVKINLQIVIVFKFDIVKSILFLAVLFSLNLIATSFDFRAKKVAEKAKSNQNYQKRYQTPKELMCRHFFSFFVPV